MADIFEIPYTNVVVCRPTDDEVDPFWGDEVLSIYKPTNSISRTVGGHIISNRTIRYSTANEPYKILCEDVTTACLNRSMKVCIEKKNVFRIPNSDDRMFRAIKINDANDDRLEPHITLLCKHKKLGHLFAIMIVGENYTFVNYELL